MFVIALAAADLVLKSGLCKSFKTGRIRCSRRAASSGSAGGLICLPVGSSRFLLRFLGFDFPIMRAVDGFVSFEGIELSCTRRRVCCCKVLNLLTVPHHHKSF